jgi:protein-S-isoprenylcysteine O-methyltransferase Ste14
MPNDPTSPAKPTPIVQIGSYKLTGWRALVVQLVVGGAIGALIALRIKASAGSGGASAHFAANWPFFVSIALWVAFTVYWSIAATRASAAKSSESKASRQFHVLLVNGSLLLLFISVPGLRARFLPNAPFLVPLGLTIQAASLVLAIAARRHLGRNWSGEVTVKVDHELVRSGPYRRIRHPIYTAIIGMYVGPAVMIGEMHSLLAVAIIIAAYWRKVGLEEHVLREEFGATYDDYARHSWAVIPPVW